MSLQLRIRERSPSASAHQMIIIELDDDYRFAPLVALIDTALTQGRRVRLRTRDQHTITLRAEQLQTVAVREHR